MIGVDWFECGCGLLYKFGDTCKRCGARVDAKGIQSSGQDRLENSSEDKEVNRFVSGALVPGGFKEYRRSF